MSKRDGPYPTGFTLLEMLIVVAIIAILASAAMPQYNRAVERGYWNSAGEILLAMYSGEQVAKIASTTNTFPDGDGGAGCAAAWTCIYMDNPDTAQVDYSVDAPGGATFTAKATRTSSGKFRSIDQNKTLAGDWTLP